VQALWRWLQLIWTRRLECSCPGPVLKINQRGTCKGPTKKKINSNGTYALASQGQGPGKRSVDAAYASLSKRKEKDVAEYPKALIEVRRSLRQPEPLASDTEIQIEQNLGKTGVFLVAVQTTKDSKG
jgi:hypothetical protein